MIEDIFYSMIEEKVRPYVKMLRNSGINTTCSCEHEGYIECQSLDPSFEIDMIRKTFQENGLMEYKITLIHEQFGSSFSDWKQYIEITSSYFQGK